MHNRIAQCPYCKSMTPIEGANSVPSMTCNNCAQEFTVNPVDEKSLQTGNGSKTVSLALTIVILTSVVLGIIYYIQYHIDQNVPSHTNPIVVDKPTKDVSANSPTILPSSPPKKVQYYSNKNIPQYSVIYSLSNRRSDGGSEYYLLIPLISITNTKFRNDIESIIHDMIQKYGNSITVEIHDNRKTLELKYQQYGDQSLGRVRTDEEDAAVARHEIATYQGNNSNGPYLNTLCYFPNAYSDTPSVGQYVDTIDFQTEE